MPPIAFLLIPLVIFILGSALLLLRYRWDDFAPFQRGETDMSDVAPVLAQRHDAGWRVDATSRSRQG